jgi:hypothetical protein
MPLMRDQLIAGRINWFAPGRRGQVPVERQLDSKRLVIDVILAQLNAYTVTANTGQSRIYPRI